MRSTKMIDLWSKQVADQVKWIDRCGGTITGYVARYGDANDPNKYGDGGPAIYKADMDCLAMLTNDLNRALARRRR